MGDVLSGMDLCFNPSNLGPQDPEGHYTLGFGPIQRPNTASTWTKVNGFSESVGKTHYRHHPSMSDEELFKKGYNRVYDTLEMESNLNYVEHVVARTMKRMDQDQSLSSEILTRELGKSLAEGYAGSGSPKTP